MWSATFVDPPFLFAHFCRPFFSRRFSQFAIFGRHFFSRPFYFSRQLPYSRLPWSCWFLASCFGVFFFCFNFWIFKNEVQRGLTTWVTSSLKICRKSAFYLIPTGGEKDEHCAHSPPRGPVWGLLGLATRTFTRWCTPAPACVVALRWKPRRSVDRDQKYIQHLLQFSRAGFWGPISWC